MCVYIYLCVCIQTRQADRYLEHLIHLYFIYILYSKFVVPATGEAMGEELKARNLGLAWATLQASIVIKFFLRLGGGGIGL